jgi:hypothetical protein
MYLAKELTQKSLPEIGELFGGRDHTTVLHAVRKIARTAEECRVQPRAARAGADAERLRSDCFSNFGKAEVQFGKEFWQDPAVTSQQTKNLRILCNWSKPPETRFSGHCRS